MNTTVNLNKHWRFCSSAWPQSPSMPAIQAAPLLQPPGADPKTAAPFSIGVMVDGLLRGRPPRSRPRHRESTAEAEAEARLVLESVKQTLERGGLSMSDLVSVTVYCTDLDLYDKFNAVYRSYFKDNYPARAFVGAAKLVRGAHFEIAELPSNLSVDEFRKRSICSPST